MGTTYTNRLFLVFPVMYLYKTQKNSILELFSFPFCTAIFSFYSFVVVVSFCFIFWEFFCFVFCFIAAKSCTVLHVNLSKFQNVLIHICKLASDWQA